MAIAVTYINFNGMMVGEIRGGVTTDYLSDNQGSLIGTVDSAGNVTSTAEYYPFGEVASSTGTNPSPWGYIGCLGYFKDSLTRLYVRARHYRPDIARWMTVDPLWPHEEAYAYVKSSPVILTDPAGSAPPGCPMHGWDPGCSFNGPPGSQSDPAFWHCKSRPPVHLVSCYECLDNIYRRTGNIYKGDDGFPNTMRHCVGACLAAVQCGISCAKLIDLHEITSLDFNDSSIDLHNNHVGLGLGQANRYGDCHKNCGKALKDGLLR